MNDPNVNPYGRRGQSQQGVDLVGKRDEDPDKYAVIQSKLKGNENQITEKIIKDEVNLALQFKPPIKEYFIITTAPDDAKLQAFARLLESEVKEKSGRILSINIWGWGTIILRRPEWDSLRGFPRRQNDDSSWETEEVFHAAWDRASERPYGGGASPACPAEL